MRLRVAGGWVRDKLLGLENKYIDVVVNHGSGAEFATFLAKEINAKMPAVIKSNPDKSKHLETAHMFLTDGTDIDFAALCSETYGVKRIPITEVGSPYTDAHRRDFTVNSPFFNLKALQIEDYTGGIKDLYGKVLRIQLEP